MLCIYSILSPPPPKKLRGLCLDLQRAVPITCRHQSPEHPFSPWGGIPAWFRPRFPGLVLKASVAPGRRRNTSEISEAASFPRGSAAPTLRGCCRGRPGAPSPARVPAASPSPPHPRELRWAPPSPAGGAARGGLRGARPLLEGPLQPRNGRSDTGSKASPSEFGGVRPGAARPPRTPGPLVGGAAEAGGKPAGKPPLSFETLDVNIQEGKESHLERI